MDGPVEINIINVNGVMIDQKWIEPGDNSINSSAKFNQISKVIIDEGKNIPEINRQNNIWKAKDYFINGSLLSSNFVGDNEREYSNIF